MKKRFKIEYVDPETEQYTVICRVFEDTEDVTAEEWAEDYGYAVADKGKSTITRVPFPKGGFSR